MNAGYCRVGGAFEMHDPGGKSVEIEITCPQCKRVVKISANDAERKMKVTCPNGHEIPIVKAL